VSIKNKLVTAVTTAGLLAGLFGSAFVPSANATAGRAGGAQVVQASRTTIKTGSAVTCAGIQDTLANNSKACGDEGTDFTYVRKYGFKSDLYFATDAEDDNGSLHFKFYTTTGAAFDFENGAGTDLALEATSSNSGVLVAWAYSSDATAVACNVSAGAADPEDVASASDVMVGAPADAGDAWQLCLFAATATTAATSTITIKADGVVAATVTVTAVGAVASVELSAYDVTDSNGVFIAEENDTVANFWKIVAKDSAGTVINGKVGGTLTAGDVSESNLDFTNYTLNPKNQNGNAKLNGTVIAVLEDGTTAAKASASAGWQLFELADSDTHASGPCQEDTTAGSEPNGDGDAGKTYAVKVSSGTVHSNAVTITCTSGFDAATVVSVAAVDNNWERVTGGDLTYEDEYDDNTIYIVMNLKDGAGRQLGAGLNITRADVEEAVSFGTALNWSSTAVDDLLTDGSGQIVLGDISPAVTTAKKYSYGIKAIVNAGAYAEGDDDDKIYKWYYLSYNAADSSAAPIVPTVKRNALKRKATITVNCGLSDSLEVVPFDVELANGDLVVYDRKADIDGVVKLVLNKRNTVVRVVAVCTDGDSEVATVRFR
jgi:hypothetical protein